MGFLDTLGKVAGEVVKNGIEDLNKKNEKIQYYKERNDRYDDKKLYDKYKTSHGEEKMACALLLKERGYGN